MGLTHIAVQIRNRETTDTFSANFLVDTGATDSMVPACELIRIGVKPNHKKTYELANGELAKYDVGYAEFSFMDETIESRVIFGPDNAELILGVLASGSGWGGSRSVESKAQKASGASAKNGRLAKLAIAARAILN